MAFTAMTRLQIRRRVQEMMRDDGFPVSSINEALDRVIAGIANGGRYRFQEGSTDITLVTSTISYTMTTTLTGDIDVIYAPNTSSVAALRKMDYYDGLAEGRFSTAGTTGVPEVFALPGAGTTIYVDPPPDSTANGKTVRVFGYLDITPITSDLSTPSLIPARYHPTLLVYGTLAEVAPGVQVRSGDGYVPATIAYQTALTGFRDQELWQPHLPRQVKRDNRWDGFSSVGYVGRIRGGSHANE